MKELQWDAVTDAISYKIYEYNETENKYYVVTSTSETQWLISGLTNGQRYGYLVRAYNEYGGSEYTTDDLVTATPSDE